MYIYVTSKQVCGFGLLGFTFFHISLLVRIVFIKNRVTKLLQVTAVNGGREEGKEEEKDEK